MRQGIFRELLRRPFGLGAFLVLVLLYACAIFAPFLAPYRASDQSLEHSFHPPSRLVWRDGALHAQLYENVDPSAARWPEIEPVRRTRRPPAFVATDPPTVADPRADQSTP